MFFNKQKDNEFYKIANLKSMQGDYIGSLPYFDKALELYPFFDEIYLNRGLVKTLYLEDYRGAIYDFTKSIEYNGYLKIHPDNIKQNLRMSYIHRAECKYYLEDYRGALIDFNRAFEIEPFNFGKEYRQRGFCKIILGDVEGGCLDWSKAGEKGSNVYDLIKEYCN